MKFEIDKLAAVFPYVTKAPRLTLALTALWIVSVAIEAITGIDTYPAFSLILISGLAILALLFAYSSFEKF